MRVAVVVWDLGRSGGMDAIRGHAARLGERGWEVELLGAGPAAGGGEVRAAAAARGETWDAVLATWWETVPAALALDARVHALLLQGLEERVYAPEEIFHARTAAAVLDLGLPVLAVSGWLAEQARERRPDARIFRTPVGIDKSRWAVAPLPPRTPGAPLRVLVEGQPSVALKRVPEALAAVREAHGAATSTLVCLGDPGAAAEAADHVLTDVPASEMPRVVADHDVLLKLSDAEGLGLPALEALHRGRPVVLTPYGGAEDYLKPNVNGIEVADAQAAARALETLARNRAELERLAQQAAPSVADWPDPVAATDTLADALAELAAEPPAPDVAARRLFAALWDFRAAVEEHGTVLVARRAAEQEAERLQAERDAVLASRAHRALMRLGIGARADPARSKNRSA